MERFSKSKTPRIVSAFGKLNQQKENPTQVKSLNVTKKRKSTSGIISQNTATHISNTIRKSHMSHRKSADVPIKHKSEVYTSHSVNDLFNNPKYISSIISNYNKNYVYTGHVSNEPQKHLDCLSDVVDY